MNETNFTESQIRQVMEKVFQIANKNNGKIPIYKLDDAATLAAYIAGYSSWKQYRKEHKKETILTSISVEDKKEQKEFTTKKVEVSPENIVDLKKRFTDLPILNKKAEIKENKKNIYKIIVGKDYNTVTKSNEFKNIWVENTCFVGSETIFLDSAKNSLMEDIQPIIEFSSKSGKDKIDPINEIFSGDYLEDYLGGSSSDHRDFQFIWGFLIKHLSQQYKMKFTANFLLETLELEFVVSIWSLLSQENSFLGGMLLTYIKSISNIKNEGFTISLSGEAQKKHWDNVVKIRSKLKELQKAYEDGVFSYEGNFLGNYIVEKKSASIYIPEKSNKLVLNTVDFLIETTSLAYSKLVEGLSIKDHAVFIFNTHESLNKLPIESDYVFFFSQILPFEISKLYFYNQVVFSKHQSFIEPNEDFLKKFYFKTKIINENIFANSGDFLINLDQNSAYLWQKEYKEAETSSFSLTKFSN